MPNIKKCLKIDFRINKIVIFISAEQIKKKNKKIQLQIETITSQSTPNI